jgi:ribulose-bisphosphate carboxylase large chain
MQAVNETYEADISYSPDSAGDEVIQLINVIFGNSSIQQNIRVVGFDPGREIRKRFAGPRFGIEGVRARSGRSRVGLISPVIKPQGSSVAAARRHRPVARLAVPTSSRMTMGSPTSAMAPFGERVKAVSAAVAEANAKSGGSASISSMSPATAARRWMRRSGQGSRCRRGLADAGADGLWRGSGAVA